MCSIVADTKNNIALDIAVAELLDAQKNRKDSS